MIDKGYEILGTKIQITTETPVYSAIDNAFMRFPVRSSKVTVKKVDKTRSGAVRAYWESHGGECWTYLN